jgi:glycosyltransferase involved in cell wall biosynthesis
MTVAHVYAGYVASGAEGITRNVQGLVDALRRRGEDVRLDVSRVGLADLNRLRAHARNARAARRLVRQAFGDRRVDLVHHHVNIAAMGNASRRRGREDPRVLVHVWNAVYRGRDVHGHPRNARRWPHRLFNGPRAARWGLAGAEEVIVSSRFQAQQLRSFGFQGALHIVPNGIDVDEFRPASASEREAARSRLGIQGEPAVLYYGHLSAWKGVDVAVEAFARIAREHPRAQLVIAHTGYGRAGAQLFGRIRALGIEDRVRRLGLTHVPSLLAAADIVVVPPVAAVGTACHPNVLLESLAAGVPVVATRVGSIPEALRDGQTGVLVDPSDPSELAGAIGMLADDEKVRRGLAEAARRDAVERFGWDLAARRIQSLYRGGRTTRAPPEPAPEGHGLTVQREADAWA